MNAMLALDPGTTETGFCEYSEGRVTAAGVAPNSEILEKVAAWEHDTLAIEMIASYGMAVGKEVFETVRWIGRFQQAFHDPESVILVYRKDVKMHLCQTPRAKDPNIRQALIDRIGPQGTKKAPGPTFGVKSHAWAALAVAVTATDLFMENAA